MDCLSLDCGSNPNPKIVGPYTERGVVNGLFVQGVQFVKLDYSHNGQS